MAGRLQQQLDRIEAKCDDNAADLREHMARTEALEKLHEDLHSRVKPLETHTAMWAGAGKTLSIVVPLVAALAAILKYLF